MAIACRGDYFKFGKLLSLLIRETVINHRATIGRDKPGARRRIVACRTSSSLSRGDTPGSTVITLAIASWVGLQQGVLRPHRLTYAPEETQIDSPDEEEIRYALEIIGRGNELDDEYGRRLCANCFS